MAKGSPIIELDDAIRSAYQKKRPISLEQQLAGFASTAAAQEPVFKIQLETVSAGDNYRVRFEDRYCYLHSSFDTKREMERMFEGISPETEVLLLFGLGCGYALEYAGDNLPRLEKVIVIEPSSQILSRVLREPAVVKRVQKAKTVTFVWNQSRDQITAGLINELNNHINQKVSLAFHISYRSLFRDYYDDVAQVLLQSIRNTITNMATVQGNIFLKTQNILNNLGADSIDIELLLKRLRGRPAILVSAGPSLDRNVHLLEQAKEKCVVVAVGTSVKILHNKGILPHLRAAFSPYPDENLVFDGIDDFQGVPLVYSNTLDYLVVEKYDAPKARMVMSGDPISQYFYQLSGYKHSLVGGGSTIANVTFDLLCRAGCSQVIFIGQDMAYTGMKQYATDAWGNISVDTPDNPNLIKMKDIYGEDTLTGRAFLGLKYAFEATIGAYTEIEVINSTEGGLGFDNAPNRPLQEVLDSLPPMDVAGLIKDAFDEGEALKLVADPDAARKALERVKSEIEAILNVNNERFVAIAEAMQKEGINNQIKAMEAVAGFDDRLREIPFYALVVAAELSSPFFAIKSGYQYHGTDKKKRLESLEKTWGGYTLKLHEYVQFLKELVDSQLGTDDSGK